MQIKTTTNTVWNIGTPDKEHVRTLAKALGVSEFLAKLLVAKGFTDPEIADKFVNGGAELLHDPFLLPDMDKAVARIRAALEKNEKILIYGDYDVDGVTSVSVLLLYLQSKGGNADYYIPERVGEGYGLNKAAIERFAEDGIKLIITVDSGITAGEEVALAAEHGIDVVITDHHECRETLPGAVAVVNPHRPDSKYPFTELAGVGVVFKLVCALENNKGVSKICAAYSDLVAVGTVADVMPIIGENRVIVKLGVDRLENTSNAGLRALILATFSEKRSPKNRKLTASSISYGLAPRINAAGRIGDVNRAVRLLVTQNKVEAEEIADYLCAVNRERQLIENAIFEEAVQQIESSKDFENDKVIVLTSDKWHLGVIGIVASKITERYGLPSILISFDGDVGKGSGRSVKGFNINEAISKCKEHLIKYGGHELAAGLTVSRDNVEAFRKQINEYASSAFDFENMCTYLDAEFELSGKDFSLENALEITKLEPYGLRNPEPLFYMADVTIKEIFSIGEGKHLKIMLEKDGCRIYSLYFGMPREKFPYNEGMHADFLFQLGYNDFRGMKTEQMFIKDVRPESKSTLQKKAYEEMFRLVKEGALACEKEHIPDLMNFRTIFMHIKSTLSVYDKPTSCSIYRASVKVSLDYNTSISPCMFNIALEVFAEMGLIGLERSKDPDLVYITLIKTGRKVDLNDSAFLHFVKQHAKL